MVNARPTRRRTGSWLARFLWSTLLIFGTGLLLMICVNATGLIDGEEFSPELFQRRSFYYYEIPLLGIQVTPIRRNAITSDMEQFLVDKKLVRPVRKAKAAGEASRDLEASWDLVVERRSGRVVSEGDASILCMYLDALDEDGDEFWVAWTQEHPKLGKVLWPAVAAVCRKRLYTYVPDLIRLSRSTTDEAVLKTKIDAFLVTRYVELAKKQQAAESHEVAIEIYTEALKLAPDDGDLLRGRAKSYQALKMADKAKADLAKAQDAT